MSTTVLVTDRVSEAGLYPLTKDLRFTVMRVDDSTSSEFWDALVECDALIVRSTTKVDDEMLSRATELRAIGRAGAGIDNIDVEAATERGIAVLNAAGGNTIAAAELTVGLMIALVRRIAEADASMRRGRWDRAAFGGFELQGKTLGLIGAGRIGAEVALRCQAFGMRVIVYDPYLPEGRARSLDVELVDLDMVLDEADVISIHVPLSDETKGLVGIEALERMKETAYLINASRGGVVDEDALAAALSEGKVAGAALDVFEREPLPKGSPLLSAPNLVLTPHLGGSTAEAQVAVAAEVAEGIKAVLGKGDLSQAVNAAELTAR